MTELKEIKDGLENLRALIGPRYGDPRLDHPKIQQMELECRDKGREAFREWLKSPDAEAARQELEPAIKSLLLYYGEQLDLKASLTHPNNKDYVERLRQLLGAAHTKEDRGEVFEEVIMLLKHMEDEAKDNPLAGNRVVTGIQRKWTVPTALLSYSHDRFPYIKPTCSGAESGPIKEHVFAGIPWESQPTGKRYKEYCERYDEICEALQTVGIASRPTTPFEASAWMVAAHHLAKEPTEIDHLVDLVKSFPTILCGPPGTGKTYRAEQLAHRLAEDANTNNKDKKPTGGDEPTQKDKAVAIPVGLFKGAEAKGSVVFDLVQFHASFDYEDFVRGFRPIKTDGGVAFELSDGPFARMVSYALKHPDKTFLLIIDEINRADLARVLGECIYLLDRRISHEPKDEKAPSVLKAWRGECPGAVSMRYLPGNPASVPEKYAPEDHLLLAKLLVPNNFLLVGTMNTADRSIAVVDAALRRRFAFEDLAPDPDVVKLLVKDKEKSERFCRWLERLNGDGDSTGLIRDKRYQIGHSYFLEKGDPLEQSIKHKLLPLLEEYKVERRFDGSDEEVDKLLDELRRYPK